MQKWEYKTLKIKTHGFFGGKIDEEDLEAQLNEYGEDGWEVVSCFDTNQSEGSSLNVVIVMKRPKEASRF